MPAQPFHHGTLREELLLEAAGVLRSEGVEALSLRELARRAGVSHGAPRRHFADRQALLDAVAEQGFGRLTQSMQEVLAADDPDASARFTAGARAYVRFALAEGPLYDFMFSRKYGATTPALDEAADQFFRAASEVLAPGSGEKGTSRAGDVRRFLVLAALQGIVGLVATGRLDQVWIPELIEEAARSFVASDSGRRPAGRHR